MTFSFRAWFLSCSIFCYACSGPANSLDADQFKESKISPLQPLMNASIPEEFIHNRTGEVVDSITFVPLETSPESLLATISDIKMDGDTIFIGDFRKVKQIQVYDIHGKFSHQIGRLGAGPDEYINLTDFQIDTAANRVYLLDGDQGKMLIFDYSGNHIGTHHLPFKFANHFLLGNDQTLYFEFGFRPNESLGLLPHNVIAYDLKNGKTLQSFFPYDSRLFKLRLKKNIFSSGPNGSYVWETLGNTVYRFDNDSLQPIYQIEGETYPFSFYGLTYREVREKSENKNYVSLDEFCELDDWYYARIDKRNFAIHHFINKHTGASLFDLSYLTGLHQAEVLLPEIFPLDGTRLGSWIEAGMCKRVKMTPDSLKQLSEEANPVLVIYQLKKQ